MTIVQLANVLQLAGFLLASIFGGILLDELVGGKIAKRLISLLVGFVDRLRELTQKLEKRIQITEEKGPEESMRLILVVCFYWIVALTTLVIGWLEHISVLLWIGVGLYSLYAMVILFAVPVLMFVPLFVPRIRALTGRIVPMRNGRELSAKEFFPEYALLAAEVVSGVVWLLILAQLFLSFFLKVSRSAMKMLANPRVPKAAFIVLGYLMLLAGLIIDAVAAF